MSMNKQEFEVGIAHAIALLGLEYKREKENGEYYMDEVLTKLKEDYDLLRRDYETLKRNYAALQDKYNDVRDGLLNLMAKED